MSLPAFWLQRKNVSWLLWPFSQCFALIIYLRRFAYHCGFLKQYKSSCPVIIVGNISVGGTGKTPLVIALVHWLKSQGWQPAIVSRGYKSLSKHYPLLVTTDMSAEVAGDEPLLMTKATACPVVIDPNRTRAVQFLEKQGCCNIIIADDGLQHYALQRELEIVVFDHNRQFGNGFLFPAGMLREPLKRLRSVDAVVCNGGTVYVPGVNRVYDMYLKPAELIALNQTEESCSLADFKNQAVHAVAGIGNPNRFFDLLRKYGLQVHEHPFPDHHRYQANDFKFKERLPIIMTEKDAVKCQHLVDYAWYLPVTAILPDTFYENLAKKLRGIHA